MAKLFSIVIPVFQNEANLQDTVPALLALRDKLHECALELVFVDDGSTDKSFALLEGFAARHPDIIRVVKLARNFGQKPAVQAGLRFAHGDCVGIISADLQEPPEVLVDMVAEWHRGAKFVIGERTARQEGPLHRALSGIYWQLVRRFAFPNYPRLGYDVCLLDRQVVNEINRINEKNSSIFVLIYWLGYPAVRIPITRRLRHKGTSQQRLWRKISLTVDTLIGFTYLPARLITFIGLTVGTLCVLYFIYLLGNWFWFHAAPPGWMTFAGLLTLLGALGLFSIGIVTEYLLRILDEARKRPPYVVDVVVEIELPRSSK